jgi:hypothetical protein
VLQDTYLYIAVAWSYNGVRNAIRQTDMAVAVWRHYTEICSPLKSEWNDVSHKDKAFAHTPHEKHLRESGNKVPRIFLPRHQQDVSVKL